MTGEELRELFADKIEDYLEENPAAYYEGRVRYGTRGLAERMTHNASIGSAYIPAPSIRYACRELGIAPNGRAVQRVLTRGA